MKQIAKKFILWFLKLLAKRRLKMFKGKIIAVTGSVGKTTTKDAIFSVLNSQYKVKRNKGSMNSDFGLLLTILDIESGYSSATKWTWYLIMGVVHSFMRDHNEVLLLELGVDKPGDMDFLTSVVKPDIAVFTNISPVHIDEGQFADLQEIAKEKLKLLEALKEGGKAIFNIDNSFLDQAYQGFNKKQRIGYAVSNKDGEYYASTVKNDLEGLSFYLHGPRDLKAKVESDVLGDFNAYCLTAAMICALEVGMSLENAVLAAKRFQLPPGRMSLIEGVNNSLILDSTYNSSPVALKEAVKMLDKLAGDRRRVAILGNMNELGERSEELHAMVGKSVPGRVDLLITVGKDAKYIAEKALERGMNPGTVFSFTYTSEAIDFFKKHIKEGDIILAKGSQNRIRLEKFVKEFMEHPDEAKDLLVRQSNVWQAKL